MLNKRLTEQVLKHAEEAYPEEACGIILKVGRAKKYVRCTNTSKDATEEFRIAGEEYAELEDQGEIVAIVHSHPDATSQPSVRDRAMCSSGDVPWVIVSWPDGDVNTIVPEDAPLIGRPFVHGTDWDCVGLINDYYERMLGITLPKFPHMEVDGVYWWEDPDAPSFYEDCHEACGFYKVTDGSLKQHDIIVMQIQADKPNHGAIYTGDNMILHHMFGRLSKKDVWGKGSYWDEHTVFVLRHSEVNVDE